MANFISKSASVERNEILSLLKWVRDTKPSGVSVRSHEAIYQRILNLESGWRHEDEVTKELQRPRGKRSTLLMNGFIFGRGSDALEIDHLWVNQYGFLYIIESKSYAHNSIVRVNKAREWEFKSTRGTHKTVDSPFEQTEQAKAKLLKLLRGLPPGKWPFPIESVMVRQLVVIPDETIFDSAVEKIPVIRVGQIKDHGKFELAMQTADEHRLVGDAVVAAKSIASLARHLMGEEKIFEDRIRAACKALESIASYPSARFYLLKAGIPARVADPLIAKHFGAPEQPSAAPPAAATPASVPQPALDQQQRRSCEASGCARALSDKEMEHMNKPGLQKKYGGRYYCYSCRRRLGRDLAAS